MRCEQLRRLKFFPPRLKIPSIVAICRSSAGGIEHEPHSVEASALAFCHAYMLVCNSRHSYVGRTNVMGNQWSSVQWPYSAYFLFDGRTHFRSRWLHLCL